jgi:cellulose biosynthesis protein BcsQ
MRRLLRTAEVFRHLSLAAGREGPVVVDTKSDLGILTRNAIVASDLLVMPVADDPSLREADRLFEVMARCGMPQERGRVLLSMINRRIKYQEGQEHDILALLVKRTQERGYPLLESFLSRSPKIESLTTNPDGRPRSILAAAPGSIVTLQMRHVADELLKWLDQVPVARHTESGFAIQFLAADDSLRELVAEAA